MENTPVNISVQNVRTILEKSGLIVMIEFIFEGCLKSITKKSSVKMSIEAPVPLKNLLDNLKNDLGDLIPYGSDTSDTQLLSNLAFYRSNHMLRIDDLIELEDKISVLLPTTGG